MALPDTFQLTAASARTSGIAAASIVAGSNYLGSAIDNATNLDMYADLEVVWTAGTNPVANTVLEVYVLYASDGTNYETGAGVGSGSGDVDPVAPIVGVVPVYANTSTHRYVVRGVLLEPFPFKILIKSEIAQTATVTVNAKTYNQKVVD